MRRPVFFLLVILLILPSAIPAQAQTDSWIQSGCHPQVVDRIIATTDVLDFQEACTQYNRCNPYSGDNAICQFSTFITLLEQCPLDDEFCQDGAKLFAAALLAYSDFDLPQEISDRVPVGLEAFWNGDDAGALEAFQVSLPAEIYYDEDPMIDFSQGVLRERLGQPEQALSSYSDAYSQSFVQPLVSYVRAQLYGELGRLDEASFDANALALYLADDTEASDFGDITELPAFIAPLVAQYPLDENVMEEWLMYPVSLTSSGVGGNYTSDLTAEPPRTVQIGIFDDPNAIVAIGLKNWDRSGFSEGDYNILQVIPASEDGTSYNLMYPIIGEGGGAMRLTAMEGGTFSGSEVIGFFEGGGQWSFMLAPTNAPDPRTVLDSQRICEGSVLSRLSIGDVVAGVSNFRDLLVITDGPGGATIAEVEGGYSSVTIIGGPTCLDGITWWQGYQFSGEIGWIAENDGYSYNVYPSLLWADILEERFTCDGNPPPLPPRLSVDTTALVLPDLDANNIRDYPSSEGEILGIIPPDTTFQVIGGPVCIENIIWWYADYNGLIGWTAEGEGETYWLAPVE